MMASIDAIEGAMRTTLTIDAKLLADAQAYSGIKEKTALVREAQLEQLTAS